MLKSVKTENHSSLAYLWEKLGLAIDDDRLFDIRDHLRGIMAQKRNAPDYERMASYVEAKFDVRMSAGYLERLVN